MLFGKKKVVKLQVLGMTCGHCAANVVKALESLDGVKSARVKLSRKMAVVSLSDDVPLETMLEAVSDAGYEPSVL